VTSRDITIAVRLKRY